jgi:hypothetical protein
METQMPKTIEINRGVETFNDQIDISRNNPDRKPFGAKGTDQFHLGSEYDQPSAPPTTETPPPVQENKFIHKLANGKVLEAKSVEELAGLIEKALQQPQTPAEVLELDDKAPYVPLSFQRRELTLQEQADILNIQKENPQKAMRMLLEAELGAPADKVISTLSASEQREAIRAQNEQEAQFMMECEGYQVSRANGKKLIEYLHEQKKPINANNLKVAFKRLSATDKTLIAQPETPAAEVVGEEVLPPPTHVPTNQGRPEVEANADAAKFTAEFATWPLSKQQEYFAKKRRENRG